jgi:hypothetical protein
LFGCLLIYGDRSGQSFRLRLGRIAVPTLVGLSLAAFLFPPYYEGDCEDKEARPPFPMSLHIGHNVTQKLLTMPYYCNTLIAIGRASMANILSIDKQEAIISALAEGSGIRQIERMTGVHRDTIMRLGVRVGQGCASVLDAKMRNLSCEHLQFDELGDSSGRSRSTSNSKMIPLAAMSGRSARLMPTPNWFLRSKLASVTW